MTSLCAVSTTDPAYHRDVLRRMIHFLSFDRDLEISGFIGDESFSGRSRSPSIPDIPSRTAAAIIGSPFGGDGILIDPSNTGRMAMDRAMDFLARPPQRDSKSPLFGSGIIYSEDGIIVGRDPLGTRPMFVCLGKTSMAASDPRAFSQGNRHIETLSPSLLCDLANGTSVSTRADFLSGKSPPIGSAIEQLLSNLSKYMESLPSPRALYFSGGIDSLLLAKVCEDLGETTLITAGIEGCKDLVRARSAAAEISCPLITKEIPIETIPADAEFLLRLSGQGNPMQIAIALPILHAARAASEMGLGIAIAGHGADELFGGYHRYISESDPRGSMLADLFDLHSRGMELCDLASRGEGIEIFSPFLEYSTIELALSLDTKYLIGPSGRKIILRKAGKRAGLSGPVLKFPKCAIQYGSGVNKHVLRAVRGV